MDILITMLLGWLILVLAALAGLGMVLMLERRATSREARLRRGGSCGIHRPGVRGG